MTKAPKKSIGGLPSPLVGPSNHRPATRNHPLGGGSVAHFERPTETRQLTQSGQDGGQRHATASITRLSLVTIEVYTIGLRVDHQLPGS